MSFIPSFLQSAPQTTTFVFGAGDLTISNVITAVDLTSAIILNGGQYGDDASGFPTGAQYCYMDFADSTHIRATRGLLYAYTPNPYATIFEFNRGMLRQDIYFTAAHLATYAHGLTLGPKAFAVCSGYKSNQNVSGIELYNHASIRLNGANVDIKIGPSVAAIGIFIVDPR